VDIRVIELPVCGRYCPVRYCWLESGLRCLFAPNSSGECALSPCQRIAFTLRHSMLTPSPMQNGDGYKHIVSASLLYAKPLDSISRVGAAGVFGNLSTRSRITLGAGKACVTADFVESLRSMDVTPNVAQNHTRRRGQSTFEQHAIWATALVNRNANESSRPSDGQRSQA
jgi:hypothetical protein